MTSAARDLAPHDLIAHDLVVALGGRLVLDGVSLALRPGTVTAICGPNGAGKSTLLAALAGLLPPTAGAVRLDGQAIGTIPARNRARAIGYLPQGGELAWDVCVARLVALGRLPHGDAAGAGRGAIAAAIAALELEPLAQRPVSRLSGGERARALLARVLAGQPRWILADEPLAALDIAHQHTLIARLRQAAGAGAGVVLVLHDLAWAMNAADRVIVMDHGCIAADGAPEMALDTVTIERIWGVPMRWLGEAGMRALAPAAPVHPEWTAMPSSQPGSN